MRIAFVTNLCTHYNVGTFERLAKRYDVEFLFFSAGNEWYWPREHRLPKGRFRAVSLPGFEFGGTRISPTLPWKLLTGGFDIYIKCINGRFALPVTFAVAKLRRKPFVLWTGLWDRLDSPAHRLMFPLTRAIYRGADAIIAYGEHVKQYLIGEGVPVERIFVARQATDNRFYGRKVSKSQTGSLTARLGINSDVDIVLYMGRLESSKGLDYLLEAFAHLKRTKSVLVIAGSGSQRQHLERAATQLGISGSVRFVGYIPVKSTPAYYAIADVLVLPSITAPTGKEPWGLVVNEAFSQGVPVIASDAVGAAAGGLVMDGENGFVVPERNVQALRRALQDVLGDKRLRRSLGRKARQSVAAWGYAQNVLGYEQAIDYVRKRSQFGH